MSSSCSIWRMSWARFRAAFSSNLGIEICPFMDMSFCGTFVLPFMKATWIDPSSVTVRKYET